MKSTIYPALAVLALAAGCARHEENVAFSDDAAVRAGMTGAATPAAQPGLDKADESKVEQLIFGALLERHLWAPDGYSAIFLQADDAEVKAMMKKYAGHTPPIKDSSRARIESHVSPVDRDTGRPALILSVEVNEPNQDGSVDATGRWQGGDTVTGFRVFHLAKKDGNWQIVSVQ